MSGCDFARFDELRDAEHLDAAGVSLSAEVGARDRGVRGPEIDADAEAGRLRRPAFAVPLRDLDFGLRDDPAAARGPSGGSSTGACQPQCSSVPRNGGRPVTLPTRRTPPGRASVATVVGSPSRPSRIDSSVT